MLRPMKGFYGMGAGPAAVMAPPDGGGGGSSTLSITQYNPPGSPNGPAPAGESVDLVTSIKNLFTGGETKVAAAKVRCPAPNQDLIVDSIDQCPRAKPAGIGPLTMIAEAVRGVTGAAPQVIQAYGAIQQAQNVRRPVTQATKLPQVQQPEFPWGQTAILFGIIGLTGVTAYAVLSPKGRRATRRARARVRYSLRRRGRR